MMRFSADSISVRFDQKQILSDAYVEANAGDIIGILGRNGAGKSSFYNCLMGLHRESKGSIRIDGAFVFRRMALRHFAYLPQETFLPFDLTLMKGIRLILGRKGNYSLFEEDARAKALLSEKGGNLSVGEIRYVECLAVLSLDRPIVLLDEPFSQVEPIYCEKLIAQIQRAASGRVVFVSDHLYQNVQKVSTHLLVLANGTLRSVENDELSLIKYGYVSKEEAL
jgi:lipopolysaccharide export system ATP-binding protein